MKKLILSSFAFILLIPVFSFSEELPSTQPTITPTTQPTSGTSFDSYSIYPEMPELSGIAQWFNSLPLNKEALRGKVVLIDFWTYTCINCIRTLPYIQDWYRKYKEQGFIVLGLHSPEFEFEKDPVNIQKAIDKFGLTYPIATDSHMQMWNAFHNNVWPAHYFVDSQGRIRAVHLGEGNYQKSEALIQQLLAEIPKATKPLTKPKTDKTDIKSPPPLPTVDFSQIGSPETYLGFARRERLITSGRELVLNEWNYEGNWASEREKIILKQGTGKIRFRFSATKVNLVLHPGNQKLPGLPLQAIVRLDGKNVAPNKAGKDVQESQLLILEPRMYELINLGPKAEEHIIEIEFLGPGVAAYAFTFG